MPPMRLAVPAEVLVDDVFGQADRLEDLRAAVALDGADAHLRGDLEDALIGGLEVVLDGVGGVERVGEHAVGVEVSNRVDRQVRVDGGRAVADEAAEVVRLAGLAGLDDDRRPRAAAQADQVVMDGAGRQQRRDRRAVGTDGAVAEDQDRRAVDDGALRRITQREQARG